MVTEDKTTPFTTQADADQATEQRKALVKKILGDVSAWEEHHKEAFKRMKRNVRFVKNTGNEQWRASGVTPSEERYVANITHRFIQQKVSSLYARDPRVKAKRRQMIDNIVWDGRQETLDTAMATLGMAGGAPKGPPPDPKIELEKAKLAQSAQADQATAQLAMAKQQADAADKAAGRQIEQQKLAIDASAKKAEMDLRRQELVIKMKELGIKQQELGIARATLASGHLNQGADRVAKVGMNRETIGATAAMQAVDHSHDAALQGADQAHDAEQQKRDLAAKKVIAKKKDPTNAK